LSRRSASRQASDPDCGSTKTLMLVPVDLDFIAEHPLIAGPCHV
jgi:hypothetical protein